MRPDDPFLVYTGSAESAALLRRNLLAIADQHRGTPMARAVREVLAGRRDLADLEREADFMQLMREGVRRYEDHVATLSPEEKERLYAEAHEIADADEQDRT